MPLSPALSPLRGARGIALVLAAHGLALGLQLFTFDSGSHPDEELYLAVSSELDAAHPLTPTLEGQPVFFKPPLLFWAQAGALRLLGRHLWAARLPSLLASLGAALVLYHLLRRRVRLPHRLALLATSFSLSALGSLRFGALGMMDAALTLALLLAVDGALAAPRWRPGLLLSALAVGAATLLKGPIGLVLGLGLGAAVLLHQRQVPWRAAVAPALLAAGLALPWYLLEYQAFGQGFLDALAKEHLRKLGQRTLGGELLLLALPLLAAFPWLPLGRPALPRWARLWALLAGVVVLAYATQASRQLHYALPCVPFLAALAVLVRRSRLTRAAAALLLVPAAALLAAAVVAGATPLGALAVGSGAGVAVVAALLLRGRPLAASLAFAFTWAYAFGLWAPRFLPPSWPPGLAAAAAGQPVLLAGEDVGVARLETGLDLHLALTPVSRGAPGQLWLHRAGEAPRLEPLLRWPRLRLRTTPADVWRALQRGDVLELTEPWALSRIPGP